MKNIILPLVLLFGVFIGFFISSNLKEKNGVSSNEVILSGANNFSENNKIQLEKVEDFKESELLDFIIATELKYNKNSLNFSKYLKDIVSFIRKKSFEENSYIYKNSFDVKNIIISQLDNKKTNNFQELSKILFDIYDIELKPKFTKQQCADFLYSQDDIGKYLSDIGNLYYSKYINSPFFNHILEKEDIYLYYRDKKKILEAKKLKKSIRRIVNSSRISDFFMFNDVKKMDLKGISNMVLCEFVEDLEIQNICFKFKKALIDGDKDFIIKKFDTNKNIYDLDAYYIRFLIGNIDKKQLSEKLCFLK